jgi:uncharacterized membrane protein YqaE (UPF0057 family)
MSHPDGEIALRFDRKGGGETQGGHHPARGRLGCAGVGRKGNSTEAGAAEVGMVGCRVAFSFATALPLELLHATGLDKGCGTVVLISILTLCGWIPGAIGALIVCLNDRK